MGWLNSEKPPAKYDPGYFKALVERVRTAVNYLDASNFKDGILGSWIKDRSVSTAKLTGGLFEIGLVSLATAFTTTSTTAVNASGLAHWEIGVFPSTARCYLEVTGTSTNSTATATFELWGGGTTEPIVSTTTNKGTFEWVRSASFAPLTDAQTLVFKIKTSNASYAAGILNAKITVFL